jgi:hypothetical protein
MIFEHHTTQAATLEIAAETEFFSRGLDAAGIAMADNLLTGAPEILLVPIRAEIPMTVWLPKHPTSTHGPFLKATVINAIPASTK